ncbi:MAG: type I restriction endonuclease subunit R [Myxococcota bacterium]
MGGKMTESDVENVALAWLKSLGYTVVGGLDLAPGGPGRERDDYDVVVLRGRLRRALVKINPHVPLSAVDDAVDIVRRLDGADLVENNRRFHELVTDGVDVVYRKENRRVYDKVWLLDFDHPAHNDWLAVSQFTVARDGRARRPDIVVFVNGLPLAVLELKNPADEAATLRHALNQLWTYQTDIPALFAFNELLVISDGLQARVGTITTDPSRFMQWRAVTGTDFYPAPESARQGNAEGNDAVKCELEVLLRGIFDPRRLLDLLMNFVVFEEHAAGHGSRAGLGGVRKKLAAYYQFRAVNKALKRTLASCGAAATADRGRIGLVEHAQGSGKSLSMIFYVAKVVRHPSMCNPTLVIITDRKDLDNQLFDTFCRCGRLLRQAPVQATSREELRRLLSRASGGVIFTTVQKFLPIAEEGPPCLSRRKNIVVVADEAHRSQYGFIKGFARGMRDALPNASFIGFSATPVERRDRSTRAVFGDTIDTYDMRCAVEDGATVPIYYESRQARIELDRDERPRIDDEFEEITEGEEEAQKQRLRAKWTALEAIVGAPERTRLVARDLVEHLDSRLAAMDGKALLVCMSRRICVDMYHALVKLRPDWHGDDGKGRMKIVMSGSASDHAAWQPHVRGKAGREALARRFRNPADPLKLVIVRDMWLTGFDCPCLHTLYVDKPMRGHGLMQAIARVNRVFRDKQGGLVVDYLGLTRQLKRALADYTQAGGRGDAVIDQTRAVALMMEKYHLVVALLRGFDYRRFLSPPATRGNSRKGGNPDRSRRLSGIIAAMEHILAQQGGKERYLDAVSALSKAFALAVPHAQTVRVRDELVFFQEIRAGLAKATVEGARHAEEGMNTAIRQLVSRVVAPGRVLDLHDALGLSKPDLSVLADDFLNEVRALPQRNVAVELLRKRLHDQLTPRGRESSARTASFAGMLERAVRRYQSRAATTAQVLDDLYDLDSLVRQEQARGARLGLSEEGLAFYDALCVSDGIESLLGNKQLSRMARKLLDKVRRNVTIDWTKRQSTLAGMRVLIKRTLRGHGYPLESQEEAAQRVLRQARELCGDEVG